MWSASSADRASAKSLEINSATSEMSASTLVEKSPAIAAIPHKTVNEQIVEAFVQTPEVRKHLAKMDQHSKTRPRHRKVALVPTPEPQDAAEDFCPVFGPTFHQDAVPARM